MAHHKQSADRISALSYRTSSMVQTALTSTPIARNNPCLRPCHASPTAYPRERLGCSVRSRARIPFKGGFLRPPLFLCTPPTPDFSSSPSVSSACCIIWMAVKLCKTAHAVPCGPMSASCFRVLSFVPRWRDLIAKNRAQLLRLFELSPTQSFIDSTRFSRAHTEFQNGIIEHVSIKEASLRMLQTISEKTALEPPSIFAPVPCDATIPISCRSSAISEIENAFFRPALLLCFLIFLARWLDWFCDFFDINQLHLINFKSIKSKIDS